MSSVCVSSFCLPCECRSSHYVHSDTVKESQPSVKEDDDLPVESAASDEKHAEPAIEALETAKPSLVEDELDARLQQLVTSASGVGSTRGEVSNRRCPSLARKLTRAIPNLDKAMPELHNFLKQHPEKKEKFEAMLDLALGASKYKLFIKRKLQNLAEAGSTASPIIRESSIELCGALCLTAP